MTAFLNEPLRCISDPSFVHETLKHIESIEDRLINIGPFIVENRWGSSSRVHSFDPSNWDLPVSEVQDTDPKVLNPQLGKLATFNLTLETAKHLCETIVNLLQKKRSYLTALMAIEVGKPILEADADVAEAIDFVRFYRQNLEKLKKAELYKNGVEECFMVYEPRGVSAVISPWNFPIAIPTGMIIANLLVGNPVVFKPAEQATWLGYELYKLFLEAGFNEEQIVFAPGLGETIGEALVKSPMIGQILFTGSRAVGTRIIELSARHHSVLGFKKVIAEMGGKNAIYVDQDVDIDYAVEVVIHSAFSYAGQKCSACSRVFVHSKIKKHFIDSLSEKIKTIRIGSAKDPNTFLPYVIDKSSYHRLISIVKEAEKSGLVIAQSSYPESKSACFVPATLILEPPRDSVFNKEELFGPILSVFEVSSFDEALPLINGVDYALTGGVITKSQKIVEKAIREFNCGNLYVNRKITGALVGRHPFGGRLFSGTGFKAGGENYLLQLVQEKSVSISGYISDI
ncbi:MAG: aldehyde dehydrogenase family protein [Deltaproteobacteria bacterium]|nr:aldehyde dehydrogenase family protein [Deltaproteobacteria bacterium]